jgi:2,4-dienoyl-CoA reductase-like NADH-dependent reductase (Old Yellow Enzyme family)
VTSLSAPLELPCGARLPNRIAKAAMSEQLANADGAPGEGLVRLYERWAAGGPGLLISGNVMLDARRCGEAGNVIVEDDRHADALRRWASAATSRGAQFWMQINHPGRQAPRNIDPHPVAPSVVKMKIGGGAFARPRALEPAEIEDIIARFARTAAVAKQTGFTGVQIHAAHGYLISQFLSPRTNLRDDAWGGDAPRRRRFLLEIIAAVRAAVGPEFAVSVKLNSADFQRGGFDQDESMAVVSALARAGLDLLEISGGTYERTEMFDNGGRASTQQREAYFLEYAEKVRSTTALPLMLTGGFRSRAGMDAALASGAVDVVGLARPLAVEPDLPNRLLADASTRALSIRLNTPSKLLDAAIGGAWHQYQLQRMADGKAPDPKLSRTRALSRYVAGMFRRDK